MKLSEIIARIQFKAREMAADDKKDLVSNIEPLIEIILPRVIETVVQAIALNDVNMNVLRRDHIIAFIDGVSTATLPNGIKEAYAETMYDINDSTAVYERSFIDYIKRDAGYVPRFHIKNNKLYYKTTTGQVNGSRTFNCVTVPQLPATVNDNFDASDRVIEQIILIGAEIVGQTIESSSIALDTKSA